MAKRDVLRLGPSGANTIHICVDMQRMFAEDTEWRTPWFDRVILSIVAITARHPERATFTRFIPARSSGQGAGMWRRYYERRSSMTIDRLGPDIVDLVPELAYFVPPATIYDKHVYSPWTGSDLHLRRREKLVGTIVVTGGETEVCVLATALGAIDWAFRVVLVTDAFCSSADETHDAMMAVYLNRFGEQVE
ncbi:nicotinamidase-related amidase [Bradyrhizobium elkanii]